MSVIAESIRAAAKALPFPGWGGGGWGGQWGGSSGAWGTWGGRFPMFKGQPGDRDWSKILGDGSGSSIVEACVLWMCRNFTQAPPIVVETGDDGIPQTVRGHPLVQRLRRPNAYYSGTLLWYGLLTSFIVDGNAYMLKRRNDSGRVADVWYTPHFMLEPRWNPSGDNFIDYYEYIVMGRRYPVAVEDVYHLRYGLDPENTRKGRSPLRTLFHELGVDEEAGRFTSSILHNLGVPGVVIAPGKDSKGSLDDAAREQIKQKFKDSFGGDKRGDPIVMSKPTDIEQFGFSPNDMDLGAIRDIPEERVTAVLGMPAAVVGFGTGLQTAKVGATMSELRDQAGENCLVPTYTLVADELSVQMLPEYVKNSVELETHEVAFDLSRVRWFAEAQGKIAERQSTLARSGIAMRAETRAAVGLRVRPEDNIFIPSPGVQEIRPDGTLVVTTPPPAAAQAQAAAAKELELERTKAREREEAKDAALLEGMREIGRSIAELATATKARSPDIGFEVLRDQSGRLAGVTRTAAGGN